MDRTSSTPGRERVSGQALRPTQPPAQLAERLFPRG
jgi:hypothetical protein